MSILTLSLVVGLHTAGAQPEGAGAHTEIRSTEPDVQRSPLLKMLSTTGQPNPSEGDERSAGELLEAATEAAEAMDVEAARAKLEALMARYGGTRAARAAQRLESELAVVGKPEAELEVERWFQGSAADVEGGKATLYVFWEAWCPHCEHEIPMLSETYNKFKPQGLSIVGLTRQTRDVTDDQITTFISEQHVSYPIAKENGDSLSRHYGVRGIPAAAVVKDGEVVWRGHPARLTDEMISRWLED